MAVLKNVSDCKLSREAISHLRSRQEEHRETAARHIASRLYQVTPNTSAHPSASLNTSTLSEIPAQQRVSRLPQGQASLQQLHRGATYHLVVWKTGRSLGRGLVSADQLWLHYVTSTL